VQKITTFLWFDNEAEEAAQFYVSVFKNSKIGAVNRYTESVSAAAQRPAGSVMLVNFELDGQKFAALNGGPIFKFTEAISLMVNCETQEEVDTLWSKLSEGGEEGPCGWLKDKYGLSWQITPVIFERLMSDPDPGKQDAVMAAMLQMTKMDIAKLQAAYDAA
jgi:predicted 3-demethylubiquinone-9 3-methyltransferase (glyoxalase superfamily)